MLILLPLKADGQIFIGGIEAIIHQIANSIAIDRANKVTRLYPRPVGRAFRYYFTHPSIHFWHKLFLRKKRPGADLKIVPRGNADMYPDDYNRDGGIRQIFWTGVCCQGCCKISCALRAQEKKRLG